MKDLIDYSNTEYLIINKYLKKIIFSETQLKILVTKIFIEDKNLLQSKLDSLQITYYDKVDPYCWVFDLIKQASKSINDLNEFGLKPLFESNMKLVDLKIKIEDELFTLSDAHYQRYFTLEDNYRA